MASTVTPTTLGFGKYGNTTLNRSLVTIFSALSLFGASVIIVTYITWKDIRSTSRKILVYISVADCVTVASYLFGAWLPPNTNSPYCTAQSFLATTANMWSFFWTTFLAVFLYLTVARQRLRLAKTMFYGFHFIGWGVPLLIVCIALQRNILGNDRDIYSSAWCWVRVQNIGEGNSSIIFWMLITGKLWEFVMFIIVIVFYSLLKCHINEEIARNERYQMKDYSQEAAKKATKLQFVPLILLFLRFWGMIRFYIYITSSVNESESTRNFQVYLIYIQGICESAQGFANFVLFCLFTEKFHSNLRRAMYHHWPKCFYRLRWTYKPEQPDTSYNSFLSVESNSREMNESTSLLRTSYHTTGMINTTSILSNSSEGSIP